MSNKANDEKSLGEQIGYLAGIMLGQIVGVILVYFTFNEVISSLLELNSISLGQSALIYFSVRALQVGTESKLGGSGTNAR